MGNSNRQAWLDTNVILRYLLRDSEELFQVVSPVFAQAESGELTLYLHPLIIAELVWTLDSFYGYEKREIVNVLSSFIDARGLEVVDKETVRLALEDYYAKNVDYIDAYLAAYASHNGPQTVITLDKKHFGRLTEKIKLLHW